MPKIKAFGKMSDEKLAFVAIVLSIRWSNVAGNLK